ncbi:MAG: Metallo-beta-lactamase L1 precursor [Candidatus Heimdallarchaeota archaeon AB_125]|nr:MAG: Metallo-beta-lactamase L1 precursor [Candidatus Heimdallarchaeota archaeon AB_125]
MGSVQQLKIPASISIIDLEKVNCYLVETEKGFILIDTGFTKCRLKLDAFLSNKGITPENQTLTLILLTHGDFDHSGNARYLKEKYNSKIALHNDDIGMVEHGDITWNRNMNVFLRILGKLMTVLLGMQLKKKDRFLPDIVLENEQKLDEYGLSAKIITLPGHSKGSVGVLTEDGHFFCGDILENLKQPDQASMVADRTDMKQSIEKISSLEFKYVYPGHGRPFEKKAYLT